MPIKYGELTIIYDRKETNLFSSLTNLFMPQKSSKNTKYIFLFDDGEICDTITDLQFHFYYSYSTNLPLYFKKIGKPKKNNFIEPTYFYRNNEGASEEIKRNDYKLYFKKLFSSYPNYNPSLIIPSTYNRVYYRYKYFEHDVLGLFHIKSNEQMPIFKFAYDSDEFTKEEIIYIIYNIFDHDD